MACREDFNPSASSNLRGADLLMEFSRKDRHRVREAKGLWNPFLMEQQFPGSDFEEQCSVPRGTPEGGTDTDIGEVGSWGEVSKATALKSELKAKLQSK